MSGLRDALEALAEAGVTQVICRPLGVFVVIDGQEIRVMGRLKPDQEWQTAPGHLALLEHALREEIESRGLWWQLTSEGHIVTVVIRLRYAGPGYWEEARCEAPTAVEALAGAVLRALGEGGR